MFVVLAAFPSNYNANSERNFKMLQKRKCGLGVFRLQSIILSDVDIILEGNNQEVEVAN